VLDEIDQLDSRKQSVLYTVFEWPSAPKSKLVLIGIANALDLTDRILPRLQARCDLRPQLLHFTPYTKLEIVNILTERLKQVNITLKIWCYSTDSLVNLAVVIVTIFT
jgi:cell division control protein 6